MIEDVEVEPMVAIDRAADRAGCTVARALAAGWSVDRRNAEGGHGR